MAQKSWRMDLMGRQGGQVRNVPSHGASLAARLGGGEKKRRKGVLERLRKELFAYFQMVSRQNVCSPR
jgi:hypothetical protein